MVINPAQRHAVAWKWKNILDDEERALLISDGYGHTVSVSHDCPFAVVVGWSWRETTSGHFSMCNNFSYYFYIFLFCFYHITSQRYVYGERNVMKITVLA